MAAFTITDLTFKYPLAEKKALTGVNLTVNYGEFIVICGKSGCGKSTLLRNLKTVLAPHGEKTGQVCFYGRPLERVEQREQASRIGYVLQNPDNQIVTDKVWHELAFGLESLGCDTKTIRLRVAEMASFFGIQEWFMWDVSKLSGGQKQLLNLAAVMVMQPDVLILDEPTAQLDPIAAGDFLETVRKINREIGTTVILTEHRLEDVLPMADRAVVMDKGRVIIEDTPGNAAAQLARLGHDMFAAMPSPLVAYSRLYAEGIGRELACPIDVRQGRAWLTELLRGKRLCKTALAADGEADPSGEEPVIRMKDVWFRYSKNEKDVVKDLSLSVYAGELFCIVGGNGTGKTTALTLISGINRPYRGKIAIKENGAGRLGVLPQNPQTVFAESTVRRDLLEILDGNLTAEEKSERVREAAELVEIDWLLDMHPYDLSGGEQQRAALAKILLLNPQILLLDEPTKGIDPHFKKKLAVILKRLQDRGVTIVMVSHDVEFCGRYGDRCAMFFDGNIVTTGTPRQFFSGNSFYTTAANRMSRHIFENAVTAEDVAELVRINLRDGGDDMPDGGKAGGAEPQMQDAPASKRRGAKLLRTAVIGLMAALAPATLFAGIFLLNDRKFYFISILLVLYSMLPFFLLFERRKPQARELIVISVLIALAVAGRAAFFMIPSFKPVAAIVILSAVCLGPQAGFLVGAMSAFLSNFLLGQGPWTPWQMFAFGVIGLVAGFLAQRGWLSLQRPPLIIFGALMAFFVYGGLVDLWTIFGFYPQPSLKVAVTVYTLAVPFNAIHGIATAVFLYFLAKPMIEKLERIKRKYGLLS